VGCGLGYFIEMAAKYYECNGIDVSEYAISCANKRIKNAIMTTGDANSLEFNDDYFDIITCFDVLEHLPYPQNTMGEFNRTLKDQGILVISVPNTESIGLEWKGKDWFGYRDPTHTSLLSPRDWEKLLEKYGFTIIDIRYDGLWDPPYFKRIPNIIQYVSFTIPSMILFWLGFRFPHRFGENIIFVAKSSRSTKRDLS
jgi:SAM-dependent methyltransferase